MSTVKIRAALETALDTMVGIIPYMNILKSTAGSPAIFETAAPHLLVSGLTVSIVGHTVVGQIIDESYVVEVVGDTTFSLIDPRMDLPLTTVLDGVGGEVQAELTAWEQASFSPVSGVPYQKVHILRATPENPSFGNMHREIGYMQVTLCYPSKVGTLAASIRADAIQAFFKRGSTMTFSGLTVHVSRTPEILSGLSDDIDYELPVRVPYYADVYS